MIMEKIIEIRKTKNDVMNLIRNMFKNYDMKVENEELSNLVDEHIEDINHSLQDKLVDSLQEIVRKYKEEKKER